MLLAMSILGMPGVRSDAGPLEHREVTATSGGKLKVDSMGGSIEIKTHDQPTVVVDSAMRARQGFSTDVADQLDVACDASDGNVTVVVRWKDGFNAFNTDVGGLLTVVVPDALTALRARTGGGDITAGAIDGTVNADTGGGTIRLGRVNGAVTGHTGGGDIEVESAVGDVHLTTGGGSIAADHVTGDVTAKTGGGNLKFNDVAGGINANTGGGSIRVGIRARQSAISPMKLSTGGGNIRPYAAGDFKADLSANSASGDVTCELMMQGTMRQGGFHGKVNGGGPDVTLDTSGGSIKVLSAHP